MSIETLKQVLHSGVWGTIGPYSLQAAELLAKHTGAGHCLLTYSGGTALEAALRAVGAYHGVGVLVPATGAKVVRLCPNLTGAVPVTCGSGSGKIGLADVKAAVSADPALKCAVIDIETVEELQEIREFLGDAKIPLILWAGGRLISEYRGIPLCGLADAVVYSFGKGADIYAGVAGALVTDSEEMFCAAYAAHNCGRAPGGAVSVFTDGSVGGNMRITEWQAAIIYDALKKRVE